jgi:hypothetical protein
MILLADRRRHDAIAGPFDMTIDLQAVQVMEDGDKRQN